MTRNPDNKLMHTFETRPALLAQGARDRRVGDQQDARGAAHVEREGEGREPPSGRKDRRAGGRITGWRHHSADLMRLYIRQI